MRIAIVNYGLGNLGSVRRALEDLGAAPYICNDPLSLAKADRIVLPGVGSFSEGMDRLTEGGWATPIRESVLVGLKPLLGICLGMQMLADEGEEGGGRAGLGLIAGTVSRLNVLGCSLRIPHVGWNDVQFSVNEPLFSHVPQSSDFYFVHSYGFVPSEHERVAAYTSYGVDVVAAVHRGNVFGTQFHPEKSSKAGRQVLKNFLEFLPC